MDKRTHELQRHPSSPYVKAKMRPHFWWPSRLSDTTKWLAKCTRCDQFQGQRYAAHNMHRARPASRPGAHIAMDFKSIGESDEGFRELLVICCPGTGDLRLCAQKNRTAATTLVSFAHHCEAEWGVPVLIQSDQAAEFTGRVVSEYCQQNNTRQTTTRGYNARGHTEGERIMRWLNECCRALSDGQYKR
jgi:hypothetical protein